MNCLRTGLGIALVAAMFGSALAKLPPPPPQTDEQKAAAADKKAKEDAATAQAQTRAEDRVASHYIADQRAKGITVTPQLGPGPAPAPAAAPVAAANASTGSTAGAPKPTTPQGNTPAGNATSASEKDPAKK